MGGLVYFELFLAGPPTPLSVLSLSTYIIAKFRISSIQNSKKASQTVQHKRLVFVVDQSNPPDSHSLYDADGNEVWMRSGSIPTLSPAETEANSPSTLGPPTACGSTDPSFSIAPSQSRAEPLTSALVSLPAGMSYHISHLGRLPSDDFIRPSTLQGTNTPIEVSHDLVLEMKFEVPGKGDCEILRVSRPLTISSVSDMSMPLFSWSINGEIST